MWFLYNTNHLRIMAVWNEAQGVVRKMLQCLEEYEKVFWGAETASFAGSLTYIFFNLQSHWRIWRTSEWFKTLGIWKCFFFHHFQSQHLRISSLFCDPQDFSIANAGGIYLFQLHRFITLSSKTANPIGR